MIWDLEICIKPNYLYCNHAFHVISKTVGDDISVSPMKVSANLLQITCWCLLGSGPSISANFVSKEDQNIFRLSSLWPRSGHLKSANYHMAPKKQAHFWVPAYIKTWCGSTGLLCPAVLSPSVAKTRGLAKTARIQDCSPEKPEGKPVLLALNQGYDRSLWGQTQLASSWKDAAREPAGRSTGHRATFRQALAARTESPGARTWLFNLGKSSPLLRTDRHLKMKKGVTLRSPFSSGDCNRKAISLTEQCLNSLLTPLVSAHPSRRDSAGFIIFS